MEHEVRGIGEEFLALPSQLQMVCGTAAGWAREQEMGWGGGLEMHRGLQRRCNNTTILGPIQVREGSARAENSLQG